MSGPGQPTDPAGGAPTPEPPPATPPPPAAPPPTPPADASGANWGQEQKPPEWVQQAQNWRPADVAAGPAPGVAYADLTTRIIAFIIDGIILAIGFWIVFVIILSALFFSFGGALVFAVLAFVLYAVASAVYFVYTWTTMRASPGQKVMNLQTVNESDGATLSQNQAITRWAYLYGPNALATAFSLSPYGGLGLGAAAFLGTLISLASLAYYIYLIYTTANDPKRQGFHDKQSRTVVVKSSPAAG
ncbi:MAG TPA: RDD family protein [Candidatus Limnocylindrales bacterium]|jgi:uncharacterized RDD family membrane protein YckC